MLVRVNLWLSAALVEEERAEEEVGASFTAANALPRQPLGLPALWHVAARALVPASRPQPRSGLLPAYSLQGREPQLPPLDMLDLLHAGQRGVHNFGLEMATQVGCSACDACNGIHTHTGNDVAALKRRGVHASSVRHGACHAARGTHHAAAAAVPHLM